MIQPSFDQIISVRGWQNSDFDAAVVLNRESEEHINMTSETGDWARDMQGISEIFMGSGGQFLLGHIREELVVMGGFKIHPANDDLLKPVAEVKRMRVTPPLQGKRIGPWFLGLIEDRILEVGITDVRLSTTSEQEGALKIYERAGYDETGRETIDRGPEKGLIVVSFVKSLAA
jgi:GNAT superfamily N-acetyltransferase